MCSKVREEYKSKVGIFVEARCLNIDIRGTTPEPPPMRSSGPPSEVVQVKGPPIGPRIKVDVQVVIAWRRFADDAIPSHGGTRANRQRDAGHPRGVAPLEAHRSLIHTRIVGRLGERWRVGGRGGTAFTLATSVTAGAVIVLPLQAVSHPCASLPG